MASMHASAVLLGEKAVLIRGTSGIGKSRLALELIQTVPQAVLIGDDRLHGQVSHGRLIVRPAVELAGLIEVRGLGIRRLDHAAAGVVVLVVDLGAEDAARLPEPAATHCDIDGVRLARLPLAEGGIAAMAVRAWFETAAM